MADLKISQLTGGGASQAADEYIINRGGSNFKVTGANLGKGLDAIVCSGQSLTGTQATSLVDLAATWNTTGTPTAIKLNVTDTASNASSLLMDLQVGGASQVSVTKAGQLRVPVGSASVPAVRIGTTEGVYSSAGSIVLLPNNNASGTLAVNQAWVAIQAAMSFGWTGSSGNPTASQDLLLWRDAANTLAQRNGVNAQTFRLYNTFTDASNYERGKLEWASNVLRIGTEKLGTGTARALELQTDGTTRVTVAATTGNITATGDVLTIGGANNNGLSSVSFGLYLRALGSDLTLVTANSFQLATNQRLTFGAADDLHLHRDAADQLAQRRTTNAQTFNIYNTFTSSTNYERLSIAATAAGAVRIRTNKGSGGGTARALELGTDDTTRLTVKVEGQTRFIPLTADPANAEDGDVYYNSTTNKLRVRAGGAWVDLH